MIHRAGAAGEQPETGKNLAGPDSPVSNEAIGRYPQSGWNRWSAVVLAVLWALLGTVQLMHSHHWRGLVLAAAFAALAVTAWVVPKMVVSDQGVRLFGQRVIPWSRVEDVVAPSSTRWRQPSYLVLRDGRRKQVPELSSRQVDGFRSLARQHDSAGPTGSAR